MTDELFVWDWFDDKDTYGVRRGAEVICYTNRYASGYERAKSIADIMNAAGESTSDAG